PGMKSNGSEKKGKPMADTLTKAEKNQLLLDAQRIRDLSVAFGRAVDVIAASLAAEDQDAERQKAHQERLAEEEKSAARKAQIDDAIVRLQQQYETESEKLALVRKQLADAEAELADTRRLTAAEEERRRSVREQIAANLASITGE